MTHPRMFRAALAAAWALTCGCGLEPAPPEASLKTLDSLLAGARQGDAEALGFVAPAGGRLPFLSDPYTARAQARQSSKQDGVNVFPSFAEGQPAAYAITEYWDQFPKVWVQPLYFLVAGFDPATGGPLFIDRQPVFSVSTSSRFYSSYWQIYYVVVPAGLTAKTADYASEKLIFDSGFAIRKGALTFCALGPMGTNLAWTGETAVVGGTSELPVTPHPLLPDIKIPLRSTAQGWVEGQRVWFIDFGRNRYHVGDDRVVEADALYKFAVRDADGKPHPIALPSVGGTGPQHQPREPSLVQGVPQFGALWREYLVVLNPPNGALPGANHPPAPFIPASATGLRALVAGSINSTFAGTGSTAYGALYTPLPHPTIEATLASEPALAEYTLRVARNPFECFQQPNPKFPAGPCVWIDSQRAIEANFGEALVFDTFRFSSCPLLYFKGAVVP